MTLWPRPVVTGLHTVVLSSFNRPRMVQEAIRSVLAQTYPCLQLFVADDGSNDETIAAIEKACDGDDRCTVLRHPSVEDRRGWPIRAVRWINEALKLANGETFHYLCDDDLFAPKRLERVNEHLAKSTRPVSFGKLVEFAEHDGSLMGTRFVDGPVHRAINVLDHNQVFHDASVFEKVPQGWPEADVYAIDAAFFEELLRRGFGPFEPMSHVVAFHRHHDRNLYRTLRHVDGIREANDPPRAPKHPEWH